MHTVNVDVEMILSPFMCLYVYLGPGALILFIRHRRSLASVFQSKALLPTVLPPKGVLPQRRAVAAATVPLPKLRSSLAASEF